MKDSQKKPKPTLESLLSDQQVVSGKTLLKKAKEKERELELFQRASEFEERNRRNNRTKSSS